MANTFSEDEELSMLERTQAMLEGRLVPGTKEVMEFDPSIAESSYASKRVTVEDPSKFVPAEPRAAITWRRAIKDRPKKTTAEISKAQDKYLDYLRTLPLYKNKSDEDFKEHVVKPVYDVTYADPRWRYDAEMGVVSRALMAAEKMSPLGAVIPSPETFPLTDLISKGLNKLSPGYQNLEHMESEMPMPFAPTGEQMKETQESFDTVKEGLEKEKSDLSLPRRVAEHTLPNAVRIATEFALIKKTGLPLSSKAMTKSAVPAVRAAGRASEAAQLLGIHTAVTDPQEWIDDPYGKVNNVMSSAMTGAIIGPVGEYVKPAIPRMGLTVGLIAGQTYVGNKALGADHETAMKGFWETVEMAVAFNLLGVVEGRAARNKAVKMAHGKMADAIIKDSPQTSRKDALLIVDAMAAGIKQEAIWKVSQRRLKPMIEAEKKGILPKEQKAQLDAFRARAKREYVNAEKVTKAVEENFVTRTVSKYPGKVTDQASLEKTGNQMAVDLGINPEQVQSKITWIAMKDTAAVRSMFTHLTGKKGAESVIGAFVDTIGTKRVIRIPMDRTNKWTKETILHELVHTFKPAIMTKNGVMVAHHKEFKRAEAEAIKGLTEKVKTKVSTREKLAIEDFSARRKTAEVINKRIKQLKLSTDEVNALVYDATAKVSKRPKHKVKVAGKTSYTSLLNPKEMDLNSLNKIKNNLNKYRDVAIIKHMEANVGIKPGEAQTIRRAGKQNLDIYGRILDSLGNEPLPTDDVHLRKKMLSQLQSNAIDQVKYNSPWKWFRNREKMRLLSLQDWQATRKFYDKLSRVTGKPFTEMKDLLEESYREGNLRFMEFAESSAKTTGLSKSQIEKLKPNQIKDIVNYLHTNKASDRAKLSKNDLSIAHTIRGSLAQDGPVGTRVRGIIYTNLEDAYSKIEPQLNNARLKGNMKKAGGYTKQFMRFAPSDLKGDVKATEKWILEGRAATETGKYLDFLKSSKIGTKEYYYMTEHQFDNIAQQMEAMASVPTMELFEKKMGKLNITPGFTKAQKSGAIPDYETNPFVKAMRHAHKVYTVEATQKPLRKFGNQLQAVDDMLTPHDKTVNDWYIRSVMGRYQGLSAVSEAFRATGEAWWRGYSWQPTKALWFSTRNLVQNVAIGPTQFSPIEVAKAIGRIVKRKGVTTQAAKDFHEIFRKDIDMKHQLWETLTLTNPEAGRTMGMQKLSTLGRFMMTGSDWLNRSSEFMVLHEAIDHNLKLHQGGKISTKNLFSKLNLNTVDGGQKMRFMKYLANKQYPELRKWMLIEKIRNTNYDYQKFGKSVLELNPENKAWVGLRTWPVSQFEAFYHQGIKPITRGMKVKDGSMVYEGAKNIAGGVIGHWLALETLRHTIGTKGHKWGSEPYEVGGILDWQPMSPGMAWWGESIGQFGSALSDTYKIFNDVESFRRQGGKAEQYFDTWLGRGGKQLEYFLPLVDVAKEITDKVNDKEGAKFYQVMKGLLTRYDVAYDQSIKDNYQGWQEKWITGMFGTEFVEHDHFWD